MTGAICSFNTKSANHNIILLFLSSADMLNKPWSNSVDPDQTAPV